MCAGEEGGTDGTCLQPASMPAAAHSLEVQALAVGHGLRAEEQIRPERQHGPRDESQPLRALPDPLDADASQRIAQPRAQLVQPRPERVHLRPEAARRRPHNSVRPQNSALLFSPSAALPAERRRGLHDGSDGARPACGRCSAPRLRV